MTTPVFVALLLAFGASIPAGALIAMRVGFWLVKQPVFTKMMQMDGCPICGSDGQDSARLARLREEYNRLWEYANANALEYEALTRRLSAERAPPHAP